MDVDDLAAIFEATPEGRQGMVEARQWLVGTLDGDEAGTFKALRLAAGLSQADLAKMVGLKQPNISSIESGARRPEYETVQRLACALNQTVEAVYAALDKQLEK